MSWKMKSFHTAAWVVISISGEENCSKLLGPCLFDLFLPDSFEARMAFIFLFIFSVSSCFTIVCNMFIIYVLFLSPILILLAVFGILLSPASSHFPLFLQFIRHLFSPNSILISLLNTFDTNLSTPI